ncbi:MULTISPECIES: DUF5681 domain-containing protein [unclassified Aminobacter]|uniref:DUF5681 domain-containing protein n=1 Tax=unclassified Aminobacter TaxID=2644704 RepID=UPI003757B072
MSGPSRSAPAGNPVQSSHDAAAPRRRRPPPPQAAAPSPYCKALPSTPPAPSQSVSSSNSTSEPYDVGYGKPPKAAQFKPGKSGNPKGRPKESLSLKTILQRELQQLIEIRDGDGTRKITKREALIKSLMVKAIKGDLNTIKALIVIAGEDAEPADNPVHEQALSPADQAQLRHLLGDTALDMSIGPQSRKRKD